ncbi:hypothetical protein LDC_0358, partial [sediment metagenome]
MDHLVKQRAEAALEQEAAHEEEKADALRREAERKESLEASTKNPPESYASIRRKDADRFSVTTERAELQAQYDKQRERLLGQCQGFLDQVQVYPWDEPIKLLEQAAGSPDKQMRE